MKTLHNFFFFGDKSEVAFGLKGVEKLIQRTTKIESFTTLCHTLGAN